MATSTILIDADDFRRLVTEYQSDSELVSGEVRHMTQPGIAHGVVCARVAFILMCWCNSGKMGSVMTNNVGLRTRKHPDSVRAPDVVYIRNDRLPILGEDEGWLDIAPDLCVEVLSPHDRWPDLIPKVIEYFFKGVPEVWLLDPKKKQVHLHVADAPAPTVLDTASKLTSPRLPGFECRISELFAGC